MKMEFRKCYKMKWFIPVILGAFLLFYSSVAQAVAILYTDLPTWQAAVTGSEVLTTTSVNVALADEVGSPPGADTALGNTLTFQTANTGLFRGFKVQALQAGSQFTFDDDEGGPNFPEYDNALSVGDINNFEDDDWRLTLLDSATMMAFGVDIRDNDFSDGGESLTLYSGATLLSTIDLSVLGTGTFASQFIGVTTDFTFDRVVFNEFTGGDDMAIADFYFETSSQPIPEPTTIALLGIGLAGLAGAEVRRRFRRIQMLELKAK